MIKKPINRQLRSTALLAANMMGLFDFRANRRQLCLPRIKFKYNGFLKVTQNRRGIYAELRNEWISIQSIFGQFAVKGGTVYAQELGSLDLVVVGLLQSLGNQLFLQVFHGLDQGGVFLPGY